jgi:hypothetical protein
MRHNEPDKGGPWTCIPFCLLKVEETLETQGSKLLDLSMQNFLKGRMVPQLSLGAVKKLDCLSFSCSTSLPPSLTILQATPLFSRGRVLSDVFYYHVYVNCLMSRQSRGEVKLRSENPSDPPYFDFNALSHPYDLRSCVNNTREVIGIY